MLWPSTLVLGGIAVIVGSFLPWGTCPDTRCGAEGVGFFVLVERSGIDFGPGILTGIGGVLMAACGAALFRAPGVRLFRTAPLLLAALVVVIVAGFVLRMYVFPEFLLYGPNVGVYTAAIGGVIGGAAGLGLKAQPHPGVVNEG